MSGRGWSSSPGQCGRNIGAIIMKGFWSPILRTVSLSSLG